MREIKFRAWSPYMREWVTDWDTGEPSEVTIYGDGSHRVSCLVVTSNVDTGQREHHIDVDDAILCQYTGRKSEDGVEVYEGDIVNHGDNYPSEVVFEDYEWQLKEYGYGADGYGVGTNSRWHSFLSYTNPMEVLGNVYENPELLGVRK